MSGIYKNSCIKTITKKYAQSHTTAQLIKLRQIWWINCRTDAKLELNI